MLKIWRKSQGQTLDKAISLELASTLANLDSVSVVLSSSNLILHSSHDTSSFGILRDGKIVSEELMALILLVRRTHAQTEANIEIRSSVLSSQSITLRVKVVPLSSNGKILVLIDDVSEALRIEAVRRDFVANISHELKTPIGALSLLSEAVSASSDDPDMVKHFAAKMAVTTKRLTELVQQIINLSKLQDANPLKEFESVRVGELVQEITNQSQTRAEARFIILGAEVQDEGEVFGDKEQLLMAFQNLIENAINYSPEHTRVNVTVTGDEKNVLILFKDQGIGISEQDIDRIFERFYRVDPARSRETGGTGLGLSIVKHVAAIHDGDVKVWSKTGEGSTFTLRLPRTSPLGERKSN